jgi:hypothetical protein
MSFTIPVRNIQQPSGPAGGRIHHPWSMVQGFARRSLASPSFAKGGFVQVLVSVLELGRRGARAQNVWGAAVPCPDDRMMEKYSR